MTTHPVHDEIRQLLQVIVCAADVPHGVVDPAVKYIDDRLKKHFDTPIDMIIFCPRCGTQHIDAAKPHLEGCSILKNMGAGPYECDCARWANPPHRSHECQVCKHVWRHCDVATNGVMAIATKGGADRTPHFPITRAVLTRIGKALLPFSSAFSEKTRYDRSLMVAGLDAHHFRDARVASDLVEEHLL